MKLEDKILRYLETIIYYLGGREYMANMAKDIAEIAIKDRITILNDYRKLEDDNAELKKTLARREYDIKVLAEKLSAIQKALTDFRDDEIIKVLEEQWILQKNT